jgi:TolB-like protein
MNTKLDLSILLFAALAASGVAAGKPQSALTVAVYDFTEPDRDPAGYGNKVTALVTADLTVETNLVMVERADLRKALGEQAIGASGMVSSDTAAKIGQITGAKVLVVGQVIKAAGTHLVVVANIIGTETGRLFAVKAEGTSENLLELTSEVSRKIAQKIRDQASDLLVETKSHEECLDRIVKSVQGTNRPTVSVGFHLPRGPNFASAPANTEMGLILQKAGFTVVDGNSDRKPDVEITGVMDSGMGPRRGNLFTFRAILEAKVQERRSGTIIAFDRQTGDGVDVAKAAANRAAQARAVDGFAEKVLPLLAK